MAVEVVDSPLVVAAQVLVEVVAVGLVGAAGGEEAGVMEEVVGMVVGLEVGVVAMVEEGKHESERTIL